MNVALEPANADQMIHAPQYQQTLVRGVRAIVVPTTLALAYPILVPLEAVNAEKIIHAPQYLQTLAHRVNVNVDQTQLAPLYLRVLVHRGNANAGQTQNAQEYLILALDLIVNVVLIHSAIKIRIGVLLENVNVVAVPHVLRQGKYVFQDHVPKVCTDTIKKKPL